MSEVQTLEVRLALTNSFGFDIIDQGTVEAGSVSVNDYGDVAYLNGNSFLVSDGLAAPVEVNRYIVTPFEHPNAPLQINNSGQVGATIDGTINFGDTATIWAGTDVPGDGTLIAFSARLTLPFVVIDAKSSLSNDGKMAVVAHTRAGLLQVHLSDSEVVSEDPATLLTTLPTGTDFNLMAADHNRVVIGWAFDGVEQVQLYDTPGSGISPVIASSASGDWTGIGINPAISDDGTAVVFYGELSAFGATRYHTLAGPGIFASVQTGPTIGDRMLIRVDGNLGTTADGTPIRFSDFADNRVNVVHQEFGPAGYDADALIVSFIATPTAASPAGSADDPRVFTANQAIWTNRVDIVDVAARDYHVDRPLRVVQVGDMLDGNAVMSVSLHDGLATPLETPDGTAHIPGRGEHFLAFQASTSTESYAVRASSLHDNPTAATIPPRKTQITGPALHTADLTPRITWAGLPEVAVDEWELVGYHILSGQEVVNVRVNGDLTEYTMPANASLGTHEFWVRGYNASGTLPWESRDRFYFHVVAPDPNAVVVTVTGPTGSIPDQSPTVTWAELPIGVDYDGRIYSVNRGVEVARFDRLADTSFKLPVLSTYETYSIHVRAHTIYFGMTPWSQPVLFAVSTSSPVLQSPPNIAPTGVTTDVQPQFSWTAVAGAWDYEVWLVRQNTNTLVAVATVSDPVFTPPAALTPGAYVFSVRGRSDAFEPGAWGSVPLSIVSAAPLPAIAPISPGDATFAAQEIPDVTETVPVAAFRENESAVASFSVVRPQTVPAAAQPEVDADRRCALETLTPAATRVPARIERSVDRVFVDWPEADVGFVIEPDYEQQSDIAPMLALAALPFVVGRDTKIAAVTSGERSKRPRHRRVRR